ncbi:uncharacterized protein LOC143431514 [Xylocopa sonorina]|uniref:uncharacterized protein LOC143431514 n=1 Tax=Xylocopa sonorina TaxID=1818115 RepID=UPI00403ACDE1
MEDNLYVSCIKFNGVPILPPMITQDIKREMSNYKESAINIEKKLVALRTAKHYNNDTNVARIRKDSKDLKYRKRIHTLKENLVPFEYTNGNYNETNLTDINNIQIETFECSNKNIEESLQCSKNLNVKYKFEDQINLASSTASRSEPIAASVDTDHYLNETASTKFNTIETVSEIWKPQVPKTLDIIPLTLSNSNCRENKEYQESDSDNLGDTSKLMRQGSYVLETPSPILLAHMQMQLAGSTSVPHSEYVPTSTTSANRRNECNIRQAKIEWETSESKSKESTPIELLKSSPMVRGDSDFNTASAMPRSMSSQTRRESSFAMYPATRSVDCIQTMLVKENKSDVQVNRIKKHVADNNNENNQNLQILNKCSSSSTLHSMAKLADSLEDLSERNNGSVVNNFTENLSRNTVKIQDSISKLKSPIASDKILTVYKKVQEMHKKQMAELMFRQQKEQILLQKEFEKQQLLLLTEIKKSFPDISENILSPALNQISSNSDKYFESNDNNMQSVKKLKNDLEQENELEHLHDNTKMILCPLDYLYPAINGNSAPCSTKMYTKAEKEGTEMRSNDDNYKIKLVEGFDECKRSNVSRELFPLDSKTVHVPIIDRTIYGAKHIKAANTINAYARGYLVRRMMRTERVIALKNTYKEALHCMLKLHVDAPLNRSEFNFLQRLQLQCDAASTNIVELFAQSPKKKMRVIAQDREIKQSRAERPTSARSYSFATQRTLARKKLKEMEEYQPTSFVRSCLSRSRCQTWTSDMKERLISSNILYHSIKRSTSAGAVRKPWR